MKAKHWKKVFEVLNDEDEVHFEVNSTNQGGEPCKYPIWYSSLFQSGKGEISILFDGED